MNVALWIASGLLALAFLGAGLMKALRPIPVLQEQMRWVTPERAAGVRVIGWLEVAGAVGVILPWALGVAPVLTPVAAVGLALTQVGAIPLHLHLGEAKAVPANVVLLALAVLVAVGRFAAL
ncbi:DoxX family protein [Cellulosimicrobium funkei]|uniref:DoxX family protein n=1 Tax=Cellulosimicrobium funkei TaxID=264251 RepID=UPI00203C1051|nr:DoxX family protein [Cellulosimicrobium funkei]MCM3534845.1 DoxX family protein [Cellulosimicrobium funkei]